MWAKLPSSYNRNIPEFLATVCSGTPTPANVGLPDASTVFVVIALTVLTLALAIALGAHLHLGGGGNVKAAHAPVQPKVPGPAMPATPAKNLRANSEALFRILPAEAAQGWQLAQQDDDHFTLLPGDDPELLTAPKCFVCGRPNNEGTHWRCKV